MALTYTTASGSWTIAEGTQAYNILENEVTVSNPCDCWIHQQFVNDDDDLYAELLGVKDTPLVIYFYDVSLCSDVPALLNSLPATTTSIAFA